MSVGSIIVLVLCGIALLFFFILEPKLSKQKIKNSNEYGSARFSTDKEIEKNFDKESLSNIKKAGFPISFSKDLKYAYFDNTTPHWTFLGSSGSGKSFTSVIPQCTFLAKAENKRSVFVTDPKGEIFGATSKMFKDNGYDVITIDFRNPQQSSHFNILEPIICEYEKYLENNKIAVESEKRLNPDGVKDLEEDITVELDEDIFITNQEELDSISNIMSKREEEKRLELEKTKEEVEEIVDEATLNTRMLEARNKATSHFAETNRLITSLADMIFAEKGNQDPFWNNSASNLLQGLIGFFLEEYGDGKIRREQITMTSIKKFQNSSMLKQNFSKLQKYIDAKPYGCKSKDALTSIFSASENTYKSITAVFGSKMAIFDDVNVANVTSSSDFEFDCLGKRPTALFVIVPDEDKTYFTLVTIIVGLLYKELTKLANQQDDKKLKVQIDWILDEFANCPPLNDIEAIVSVARSRGMRFQFYIQSFSQLDNVYGKEVAQIILDNCGLCYLKTSTMDTAESISKRLGKKTIESNSVSQSIGMGLLSNQNPHANQSTSLMARDLLTPDEIMQLRFKTIIFPSVGYPIFRDTVGYPSFSIYEKGSVDREVKMLEDLKDTYFTVENLGGEEVEDRTPRSRVMRDKEDRRDIINNEIIDIEKGLKIAVEELQQLLKIESLEYDIKKKDTKTYCVVSVPKVLGTKDKSEILSKLQKDDVFHIEIDNGDGGKTNIEIHEKNPIKLKEYIKEHSPKIGLSSRFSSIDRAKELNINRLNRNNNEEN